MKKSAFIAVIGRPSSGKSTLINSLCGAKVAITSPVPQTTRDIIRGIVTNDRGQIVFLDTPGLHKSNKKFNLHLALLAKSALKDSDLILYVLDASRAPEEEESLICSLLKELQVESRLVCAINKIDDKKAMPLRAEDFLKKEMPALPKERIARISALKKEGLNTLLNLLYDLAPQAPQYYDADCYTDQTVQFRIAEIVRGAAFNFLSDEIPHSLFVDVQDAVLSGTVLKAEVVIWTERDSQKGIVIGAGGSMLKKIRERSLKELSRIFDWKIILSIKVKTKNIKRSIKV